MTTLTLITALALGAPALKDREPLGTGPGYIGITFQSDEGGLLITEVKPDSPATKAGLKAGDQIQKVDGTSMLGADTSEFVRQVGSLRPGTTITLDVRRGDEALVIKVKLGSRPADFNPTPTIPRP